MSQAGPVNILNGIDLKIAKGEAIGLVGPSGSGKSTMLMVMAGLERPTSGKVTVAGQELSKFDEDAAARFRRGNVGIVFQSFHLIPTMTALENVAVPLELAMVANAFDRALEELKAVGLTHRVDHYPSQLSGGEQQRVALARAIAPRPGILFADEPTGNLDGRTGGEIMDLMFALQRERGATLVLVTHDEDLVKRCDRIVRLRDGRIDGIETVEYSAAPIFMPPAPHPVVTAEPPVPRVEALPPVAGPSEPAQIVAAPVESPAIFPEAQPVAPPVMQPAEEPTASQEPEHVAIVPAPEILPELEFSAVEAVAVTEAVSVEPQIHEVEGREPLADAASIEEPAPTAIAEATPMEPVEAEEVLVTEAMPHEPQIHEAEVREPSPDATSIAEAAPAQPVATGPESEALAEPEFRRVAAGGE